MPKKCPKIFICGLCSFSCSKKSNYISHLSTTKHKTTKNPTKILLKKMPKPYKCEHCCKTYKHISSLYKHLKKCNPEKNTLSKCIQMYPKCIHPKFTCKCKKSYKFSSGLSKHKKSCKLLQEVTQNDNNIEITSTSPLVKILNQVHINHETLDKKIDSIMEENKILKEQILNLKLGTTINNNENNLTINMFLNDKCKNAMNLEDFVEKIKFTLEDLQYTADNGYANGISNVFIKKLCTMDVTERPIHCTDHKRMQFYVKNEDVWEKDDVKLHNSIELVSKKQGSSINNWVVANPNYMESAQKCDAYFKLVNETMKSTDDKNIKNIKKKVGNNVKLEKYDME